MKRALRIGMACAIVRSGGFLLHAAGVVGPRGALLFFGASGAGKSTLAATAPVAVLGDEFVAIHGGERFTVSATGFNGDEFRAGPVEKHRVAEVFALGKGTTTEVTALAPGDALRSLVPCAVIPPIASVWRRGLANVGRFATEFPVVRLAWRLGAPPWDHLREKGLL